jgi:hypothetical protein
MDDAKVGKKAVQSVYVMVEKTAAKSVAHSVEL